MHDQGREFENQLFDALEKFCGIIKSRTTPYHPMTNGACKRMNSTVLQMLRTLPETQKTKWPEKLNKLMFAYNATKHSTTEHSPHFLLFGREPLLPLDFLLGGLPKNAQRVTCYNKYVEDWEAQMTEAYKLAKENCERVKNCAEE